MSALDEIDPKQTLKFLSLVYEASRDCLAPHEVLRLIQLDQPYASETTSAEHVSAESHRYKYLNEIRLDV